MNRWQVGSKFYPFRNKAYVMGIVNVTPDSFSDGGRYFAPEDAIRHALALEQDGASFIDLGAQSTGPGAALISAQEEIERLAPVLEGLHNRLTVPFSVDTFYPACARFALEHGAAIINDVSGSVNPQMAELVYAHNAGWILTHNDGGADFQPVYLRGVAEEVRRFFKTAIRQAENLGILQMRLCLDPGFGFGKTLQDNWLLLRELETLIPEGAACMAAFSRKRFLAAMLQTPQEADLDEITTIAHTLALQNGARFLRTHNVKAAVRAVRVWEQMQGVTHTNLLSET